MDRRTRAGSYLSFRGQPSDGRRTEMHRVLAHCSMFLLLGGRMGTPDIRPGVLSVAPARRCRAGRTTCAWSQRLSRPERLQRDPDPACCQLDSQMHKVARYHATPSRMMQHDTSETNSKGHAARFNMTWASLRS